MKSVLITFDQAYYERIMALLDRLNCRGFTYLEKVQGRGSKTGDPHFGSHACPVCVRLSLRWSMTIKSIRCWIHCIRWTYRPNSWDYVHLYGILNGPSSVRTVNK